MRLGYHTITWGGVCGDARGVTSVKDLYYRAGSSQDLLRAIADIGAAGYEGVEIFDGNAADYAERPEVLRAALDEAGVELVSVYTGGNFVYPDILEDELHRMRHAAGLAQQLGATTLVVGGGARRASGTLDEDYDRLASGLDTVTDIAEEHGLSACFHPHLTTIVESPEELDRLLPRTRIGFCPDTGHLAAGGGDPATLIRKYPDRVRHVHLKDLQSDPLQFVPLGAGEIDFTDVLTAVHETGYEGWLLVELDAYDGDPRQAADQSKAFLDEILHPRGT